MLVPSESAAASSKLNPADVGERSGLAHADEPAFAPERRPKTRSPTANSVTAPPTASTSPASSMPTIRRFERGAP